MVQSFPVYMPDLLYINDIGENTKVQIGLFADDEVFYFGVIKDCNDAESLQQNLNTLYTERTHSSSRLMQRNAPS